MPTGIRARIAKVEERLVDKLALGPVTISNIRRFKNGALGGSLLWIAALGLVRKQKAAVIKRERVRITRGPRPHNRFRIDMTIVRTERDAI